MIQKFMWKHKRPIISKALLKNKNLAGEIIIPGLRTCYRVLVIKTAWFWYRNREED